MNEFRVIGKVITAYVNKDGHYVCTVANVHDHYIDGFNIPSETFIRGFMTDKEKSSRTNVVKGDRVMLTGYFKQDITLTKSGNEKKRLNLYLTDIKLLSRSEV